MRAIDASKNGPRAGSKGVFKPLISPENLCQQCGGWGFGRGRRRSRTAHSGNSGYIDPEPDKGLMSKTTRATLALEKLGVTFTLHSYEYDPDADSIGLQAAAALGIEPGRMLKTLMAEVDGKPVCVVIPSDREVSMKKLAAVLGGKTAKMMRPADAERLTGYHVGGISPLAQKKRVPVLIEQTALGESSIFLNGGRRGLQIELSPADAVGAIGAVTHALTG